MFDYNVICYEEDGSTNVEYSLDGKTCIDHNNDAGDNTISFTSIENNVCKDISFSDSIHNDDQFVFKKIDESTTTSFVVGSSVIDVTVIIKSTLVLNNLNTTQSNSIQQYKTVSFLI